ncbi:MAG: CRISPR-associated endoribonuclease Cas6 [Patescibacteria group bacterium]
MRTVLTLVPLQDTPQPVSHHHIQSALYHILAYQGHTEVHNQSNSEQKQYRYFCFSNIYPFTPNEPFKKDTKVQLTVSSPEERYIDAITSFARAKPTILLGRYPFIITQAKTIRTRVGDQVTLRTATPIVVNIPRKRFQEYGIEEHKKNHTYWQSSIPLNAFVDLMSRNMVLKYNKYYGASLSEQMVIIKKFVLLSEKPAFVPFKGGKIIGNHWKFTIDVPNDLYRRIVSFAIDCGFGEKNSAGFGFMNMVSPTRSRTAFPGYKQNSPISSPMAP